MGIEFIIESLTNPNMYDENDNKIYLRYAWKDINWEFILCDVLNINLSVLYDNAINYWSLEQVIEMRNLIKNLYESPEQVLNNNYDVYDNNQLLSKVKEYKDDIYKLLEFFEYYVENKAIIKVF